MWKKILIILGSLVGAMIIAGGIYAYYLYDSVKDTANHIYEPVNDGGGKGESPQKHQDLDKPFSILLMGVDERKNDRGRSDTLILMTLNPKDKTMQMISIPRDTRTKIIGHGTTDKINHAYAFGGTKMAKDTVKQFLNVDVDYYIRMNMEGLASLIDAVGGVKVQNDIDWTSNGHHYRKGPLELENGKKALGYVRMRHQDPKGDFGRNDRQRKVINAVINKAASFSSFTRYSGILDAIGDNVKTDLSFDQMKKIAKNDRSARNHVKNYEVKGHGTKIDGVYYLLVNEAERKKVHHMIKEQL